MPPDLPSSRLSASSSAPATGGPVTDIQRFGTDIPRQDPPPSDLPGNNSADKDVPDGGAGTGFGGASMPPPPGPDPNRPSPKERLGDLADRLAGAANVDKLDSSFSLRHLFGNSFKRRPQEDVERELMVGTTMTTPPLSTIKAEWPQPWLFARTFVATAAVFAVLFIGWTVFESITLLPGLIIVGSFAMPAAVLIFFFEANVVRNVSIVAVLRMVFLGGAASLVFSLIGFELFDFPWLGAMVAGIVEEPAKLIAVVLVARQLQHRYILNGMLFGAAIGAGFAAFESAGYALVAALFALDTNDVIESIVLRGVFSPFAHVVWTAITAGALWRVRDGKPLNASHLKDPRFWRVMVLAIVLHTIWNSPIPNLLYIKFVVLGMIAWLVCFSLLQEGIGQVKKRQTELKLN